MIEAARACPFCGKAGPWGEPPGGCNHFVGRIARVGGRGPGPRSLGLADLARRATGYGGLRVSSSAPPPPHDVLEILAPLADGELGWWTSTPGMRAVVPEGADLLSPVDWFHDNPATMGLLEARSWQVLRWLEDHAA